MRAQGLISALHHFVHHFVYETRRQYGGVASTPRSRGHIK